MIDTGTDIDLVLGNSHRAFLTYKKVCRAARASFLRCIASELEQIAEEWINTASGETNLSKDRLISEKNRTLAQLNMFADITEQGDWLQPSLDYADATRLPAPKPDLRKMFFPMGAVIVFGAGNFPMAFSTAGNDTASALAAGCSVVVKMHPGHPETSRIAANAIHRAIAKSEMPQYVFQQVEDVSHAAGRELVLHPYTKAASFTGSYEAGRALFDIASKRPDPIPFFAEMGSINPVVLLPDAISTNKNLASVLSASILLGIGQFCTKPGLLFVLRHSENLEIFLDELGAILHRSEPGKMLNESTRENFKKRKREVLIQKGVTVHTHTASATMALVNSQDFLCNPLLNQEVFGPFMLVVICNDTDDLLRAIENLPGQLTASIFGTESALAENIAVAEALQLCSGRIIFNGTPTGVEVCASMHHGGPFPAASDARFTSVGNDAIFRFLRPVCFQNFPLAALPEELQNIPGENRIRHRVNGKWINP